jgi:Zn-dependent protease with chaperone function
MVSKNTKPLVILAFTLAIALAVYGADSRTKMKPGFNLLSPKDDVEIGRQSAREAERQLSILNDIQTGDYINTLGKNLASYAPYKNDVYPFQFKIVNDKAINAFALPGGFIYVNRGAIEAADNEAQIAGVIAHEIGHVVMRHGTHQVSESYIARAPLAVLGGALGGNAIGAIMNSAGGMGLNVAFLHFSRSAESQADLIGTQIIHDAGYDPKAMVEFFEKIEAESKGRSAEFLSDHPNPENRVSNVQHEIEKLNGALPNARENTSQFQVFKSQVVGFAAPSRSGRSGTGNRRSTSTRNGASPAAPSSRTQSYSGANLAFRYPDNWRQSGQGSAVTISPDGGMVNGSLTWGMMISPFDADSRGPGRISLDDATDQLLKQLQRNNPSMRVTRSHESVRVSGQPGYVTELSNDSPAGGPETDWIVTTIAPDGDVYYFVGVAPQNDFNLYYRAFDDIIRSVQFR